MTRGIALVAILALAGGGCATGMGADGKPLPRRTAAKVILGAVLVGTAALAVGAAVKGQSLEKDLRDESNTGALTGAEFTERDERGQRWNRIARASTFASGLSLIGLGLVWEMSVGDRLQMGAAETTVEDQRRPAAPPPGGSGAQF